MIQWNAVTWYSRLAAIVVFLGLVPALCFYVGVQFELVFDAPPVNQDISLAAAHNVATTSALSVITTVATSQSTSNQAPYILQPPGKLFPADEMADCASSTPVTDLEGNPSIVRKSATHVYNSSCYPFIGADLQTFVALDFFYEKDTNSVWHDDVIGDNTAVPPTKIDSADPATFTLISDSNGSEGFSDEYTKDKAHVYVYGQMIQGADPATFTIYDPARQSSCKYDAQDDYSLYLFGERLPAICQPSAQQ
jgi:hypothetical protein